MHLSTQPATVHLLINIKGAVVLQSDVSDISKALKIPFPHILFVTSGLICLILAVHSIKHHTCDISCLLSCIPSPSLPKSSHAPSLWCACSPPSLPPSIHLPLSCSLSPFSNSGAAPFSLCVGCLHAPEPRTLKQQAYLILWSIGLTYSATYILLH